MKPTTACLAIALAVAAFGVSGCGWPEPYIYDLHEFDRNAENFGQEPKDRDEVQICYNSRGTTPEAISKMASDECAKFGKIARYQDQDYLGCSISSPTRATFDCVKPQRSSLFSSPAESWR